MCGRTAQGLAPARIRQQLDLTLPSKPAETWIGEDKYRTSYNVAPTRYQPVVRADQKTNSYVVHMMRWGLIPRHAKAMPDYKSVLKSINARDDSLFTGPTEKHMFSHSKNHKRCILLAEGFYEWRRRGKERTPFYTKRRDGKLMLMAAIYDVAQIQGAEEPLYTYATITTNASPQLDWLHDRMPVLIPNDDIDKIRLWLDPTVPWNSTLQAMLHPCDEFLDVETVDESSGETTKKQMYALDTYQVDEKVNNVRNDSPGFTVPWNSSSNKNILNQFFMPKQESNESSVSNPPTTAVAAVDESKRVIKEEEEEEDHDFQWEQPQQESEGHEGKSEIHKSEEMDAPSESNNNPSTAEPHDEDKDFELALELSRKEHEAQEERTKLSSCPSTPPPTKSSSTSTAVSTPTVNTPDTFMVTKERGSVDLLERRRQERLQDDEQMRKVLEMSMLEAIADGHDDLAETQTASSQATEAEDLQRQEQEELDKAIAASLADHDADAHLSQQSVESASSSHMTSPGSKRAAEKTSSATTTPKKRRASSGQTLSPAASDKKEKPSQAAKITSFFKHSNS
ncbi:hypothetical protein BGZ93_006425 [Podila epicladia]|nr:hypothetical protein BGZ92_006243 [Podila epicladia]KAG0095031.1 hypothetical protein BGZ93_006425 [Podila epicladia]